MKITPIRRTGKNLQMANVFQTRQMHKSSNRVLSMNEKLVQQNHNENPFPAITNAIVNNKTFIAAKNFFSDLACNLGKMF